MKLLTKDIDAKLFAQYSKGSDLANQMVVAKIFNPYGRGTWYLLNSDPEDPDYIWAIVNLFEAEVGSVSRSELESIKVPPFRLGLERDLSFHPVNASELLKGLYEGKHYAKGGAIDESGDQEFIVETTMQYEHIFAKNEDEARNKWNQLHSKDTIKDSIVSIKKAYAKGGFIEDENAEMVESQNKAISHHTKELQSQLDMNKETPAWVVSKVSRASNDLSDVTHYLDGEKMAQGGSVGSKYIHKYYDYISIELIEPTAKGWKVKQTETISPSGKKLRTPKEKTAFFRSDEIRDLFTPTMANGGNISYTDWEEAVANSLSDKLEISFGDAQGIVEANEFYMAQAWSKGLNSEETADYIDSKSKMAKGGGVGDDYETDIKVKEIEGANYLIPPDVKGGDFVLQLGKGGSIKTIEKGEEYRYKPNSSIEKDILAKVDYIVNQTKFAGNYYIKEHKNDTYIYFLDDYDRNLVKDIPLKLTERIYRTVTRNSAIGGMSFLVKINLENGLVYVINQDLEDDNKIEFVKKGQQAQYLNLVQVEEEDYYKKGGAIDYFSKFDLNDRGNFAANIKGNNYEIIYRDDKSEMYDLFKDGVKVASDKVLRNLMSLDKYAHGGNIGDLQNEIDALYSKSGFINTDFNWRLKLLEMLQDQSIEAYNIYQKLSKNQKEDVLQEQFEIDNDMGSEGDGDIETTKENLSILLDDAKNGKKYAKGGGVGIMNKPKRGWSHKSK
jgi:hypothetical protein